MVTGRRSLWFEWLNGLFLLAVSLTMVAPLIHLLAVSLSDEMYAQAQLVSFWPKGFQLDVYREIVSLPTIWRSMGVTIYITVVGTVLSLLLTSSIAYGLSRPQTPGRKWIIRAILVTFIFHVPLIPNYLLIRGIGLLDTLWALMIPPAVGAFGVLVMKTSFQGLSTELFDAAKIDGCNEFSVYWRIALPQSRPMLATLALFGAVGLWNSYFAAIIFINDPKLYPLQVLLRKLVVLDNGNLYIGQNVGDTSSYIPPEMMKAGIILFATFPILLVYPFLQKYFVKGAMLGSLKE
jgi:ABC-type glycerol-3-phosphate transport system permease component